jgi:hypothetical protein
MYADDAERQRVAKLKGWNYLGLGIIGQIAGLLVIHSPDDLASPMGIAGQVILILFTGVLVGGCAKYAKFHRMGKGWALLGFFNAPGVFILLVIGWVRSLSKDGQGEGFSVIFAEPYRRHVWRMDVKVTLDETVGTRVHEPITLQLSRGSNVGMAMKTLAGVIPGLNDGELPNGAYLINGQEADRRMELSDGDELVVRVISPNDRDSGGSARLSG